MKTTSLTLPGASRILPFAAVLICAAALSAMPAAAGECPADQVTANGQQAGATAHKDVTDEVIASIDLSQEKVALADTMFRMRRLVVQPGGEVAWHGHGDRPAIIYIVSGAIVEYASTCAVPITHKAGDVAPETHATSHWWKNISKEPAILISADLLHNAADPKTM